MGQVVSLDFRKGDETFCHPHKLDIHLGSDGQQRSMVGEGYSLQMSHKIFGVDKDFKLKQTTSVDAYYLIMVWKFFLAQG